MIQEKFYLIVDETGDQKDIQVGAFDGEQNRITFDSSQTDATASSIGVAGTGVASKDDALSSMSEIDNAIEMVSGQRADLGSIQSRLQSTVANLEIQALNQDSARSVIEDVDVAQESAKLASNNVIKQSGISTLAQANSIPQSAMRLVG